MRACLEAAGSWPIGKQMLRLGLAVLALVLILINCLVVFNLLYLRSKTLQEVRRSSGDLAEGNIRQVSLLMGNVVNVYVEACLMLLGVLQSTYLESSTSALEPLPSLGYKDLPQSCMQYSEDLYGPYPVCLKYSSVKAFGFVSNETMAQSSMLDYVFPTLAGLAISGVSLTRLLMYFNTSNFLRVFPGTYLSNDYEPTQQVWYQDLQQNDFKLTISRVYNDSLGSQSAIFSLAVPLLDSSGLGIGAMALDIPAKSLYSSLQTYAGRGEIVFVGKDGWTLPNPNSTFWSASRKLSAGSIRQFSSSPGQVFAFDMDSRWKASAARIPNSEDWSALLVLLVPADVTEKYSEIEADAIDRAGTWLIVITALSSLLVLVSVGLCICAYSSRITDPLKGVVRMANRLHQATTSRKHIDLGELEEGDDSVQRLVTVFKQLVHRIVDNPENAKGLRFMRAPSRFPVNTVRCAPWRRQLQKLSARHIEGI